LEEFGECQERDPSVDQASDMSDSLVGEIIENQV